MTEDQEHEDQEYEDSFVRKFERDRGAGAPGEGYGIQLSRATQDQRDMAEAFEVAEATPVQGREHPVEAVDLPALDARADDPAYASPVEDRRAGVQAQELPSLEQELQSAFDAAGERDNPPARAEVAEKDWSAESFGKAFKHFRESGEREFTWRGKRFTTLTAAEAKARPAVAAPRATTDKPAVAEPEVASPASTGQGAEPAPAPSLAPRPAAESPRIAQAKGADGKPAASLAEAMQASRRQRELDAGPPADAAGPAIDPRRRDVRTRAQKDEDELLYATRGRRDAQRPVPAPIPRR